ncbi:MAG: GNAT family N-acetyltransferase [Anaerolineae bacterium]|nr:GNAT family N-acetyltransferase [Anaerolineae bacterium]
MTDMLVKLYELPDAAPILQQQTAQGITIRRAIAPEKHFVLAWIRTHFSEYWVSECDVAFARQPISCFLAVENEMVIGFGVYDTTRKGFFGPTGVSEAARGRGTGTALLLVCLHAMWHEGYGYAIIGGVGPVEFYQRAVGATVIENSTPSVYGGMLRK